MDADRFDFIARALATLPSRRTLLSLTLGGVLAALRPDDAEGKNKKRKRKKRKRRKRRKQRRKRKKQNQQVVFNDFGCVDVGKFCQSAEQCCSGICTGAACQAHDASTCTPGQDACAGEIVSCGGSSSCVTTTGNAGYCAGASICFPCTKDVDCQAACGPQAACIVCDGCEGTGGTVCAGLTFGDCSPPD